MSTPQTDQRHYWLPVPNEGTGGTRHAFRGRRWDGSPSGAAVCGMTVPMAQPSEMDWITAPSCDDCRKILIGEQR